MKPSINQGHTVPIQRSIVSADALAAVIAEAYQLQRKNYKS
jgi:hypothetical protein